ncbi:MAG: hypothetical protein A2W21_05105 [Betaproteobacteria bacterium RBG_16_66_20]|nr:MAG: hypothetical protein A2W21_05105 [Betaproteobacteria bacterium RBG_16_66_20]
MADGTSDKSNVVALVLCVILGFIGAHRYYVGKIGTGVVQLLCCVFPVLVAFQLKADASGSVAVPLALLALATLGALIVWNLVDGVLILMQRFTDKEGNTLKFN